MELAVFLLGDTSAVVGGETAISFELEFLDIHENGLVNFLVGGAGGAPPSGPGSPADPAIAALGAVSVAGGDQGIAGSELAMLLNDSFFLGAFAGCAGSASGTVRPSCQQEF